MSILIKLNVPIYQLPFRILSLTKQKLKNNIEITGDGMVRIMGRNIGKFWKEQ